jgi:hypothetical protein
VIEKITEIDTKATEYLAKAAAVPAALPPPPPPPPPPSGRGGGGGGGGGGGAMARPPRTYGRREYPVHNGVLTYYVLRMAGAMPLVSSPLVQQQLFTWFDLPPDTRNVKIEVKNRELARYEIAPITLEAEVTFTLWEINCTTYDVFYCGMYEPGQLATAGIQTLKSPPDLPAS